MMKYAESCAGLVQSHAGSMVQFSGAISIDSGRSMCGTHTSRCRSPSPSSNVSVPLRRSFKFQNCLVTQNPVISEVCRAPIAVLNHGIAALPLALSVR